MAGEMYHVKPVYHMTGVPDLPDCMYHMKSLYVTANTCTDANGMNVQELFKRQETLISRLEALKVDVEEMTTSQSAAGQKLSAPANMPKDIVINCNTSVVPHAVLSMVRRLAQSNGSLLVFHMHCSIKQSPVFDLTKCGFKKNLSATPRGKGQMVITWIWKNCDDCEVMVSPLRQVKVQGESNICRYLTRLLGECEADPLRSSIVDLWLDNAAYMIHGSNSEKADAIAQLVKRVQNNSCLTSDQLSVADMVMCSAFKRSVTSSKWLNEPAIKKWVAHTATAAQFIQ